jgi:hypothetical protein
MIIIYHGRKHIMSYATTYVEEIGFVAHHMLLTHHDMINFLDSSTT